MTKEDEKLLKSLDKIIQDIYDARELVDSSKMLNLFGRENVRSDLIDAQKYIEKIRRNLMLL